MMLHDVRMELVIFLKHLEVWHMRFSLAVILTAFPFIVFV